MGDDDRRKLLDAREVRTVGGPDALRRQPAAEDERVLADVRFGPGDETIAARIATQAQHRQLAAQGIVDLARLVPPRPRDEDTWLVRKAATCELRLEVRPVEALFQGVGNSLARGELDR